MFKLDLFNSDKLELRPFAFFAKIYSGESCVTTNTFAMKNAWNSILATQRTWWLKINRTQRCQCGSFVNNATVVKWLRQCWNTSTIFEFIYTCECKNKTPGATPAFIHFLLNANFPQKQKFCFLRSVRKVSSLRTYFNAESSSLSRYIHSTFDLFVIIIH